LKEDFAVTVRNQSPDSSEDVNDEIDGFFAKNPQTFRRKKRKRSRKAPAQERSSVDGDTDLCRTIDLDLRKSQESVRFCSRSEAICAELLRRFVPHFQLEQGVTFQVGIGKDDRGNTRTVDFLVDGVLFEYHPVRFFKNKRRCGDFRNSEEYRLYTRTFYSLSNDSREFFHSVMKARLSENYFRKRRSLLDQHPIFRRMELVVATSPEEFYFLIIRRFGRGYPKTLEKFLTLFEDLRSSLPD